MISYQQVNWSPVATIPESANSSLQFPLDELSAYADTNGRSGDLLIVQLKSGIGQTAKRRATLRSLGLTGVRASSLRSSREPSIWGHIRAVRDLIGVIELNGVLYKQILHSSEHEQLQYEKLEYGTNTRPGGLVRNARGEYFSYESDRAGVLMNWSTEDTALDILDHFRASFPDAQPISRQSASVIATAGDGSFESVGDLMSVNSSNEEWDDFHLDSQNLVAEMSTPDAMEVLRRSNPLGVLAMRLAFKSVFVTWHSAYARFVDSDHSVAEGGVSISDLDMLTNARVLLMRSGRPAFYREAEVNIQVRDRGNAKRIRI